MKIGAKYIINSIAFLIIMLWIYAAISKLISFEEFRGQMHNQSFPYWVADAAIYVVPAIELIAAGLLAFKGESVACWLVSLVLMCSFTVYIVLVLLHYWQRVPCSCGGILQHMTWKQHLVFNLTFLALITIGLILKRKEVNFQA